MQHLRKIDEWGALSDFRFDILPIEVRINSYVYKQGKISYNIFFFS